jgi:hypothetical protein
MKNPQAALLQHLVHLRGEAAIVARTRPRATALCQSRGYEASEFCVLCGILFERGPLGP